MPEDSERATHWDLMFEWGPGLRTWALEQEPGAAAEIVALELADHRRDYLDYEGPVPGGRGLVTRWDAGEYRLVSAGDDAWEVLVEGARLRGLVAIRRDRGADHSWRVSLGAAPSKG